MLIKCINNCNCCIACKFVCITITDYYTILLLLLVLLLAFGKAS